jgi:hypothetical protein
VLGLRTAEYWEAWRELLSRHGIRDAEIAIGVNSELRSTPMDASLLSIFRQRHILPAVRAILNIAFHEFPDNYLLAS